MQENIRKKLISLKDAKYQEFASSLLPNVNNMIGIRLPILRKLAKEIKQSNWQEFLKVKSMHFEETLLQGMVIGLLNVEIQEKLKLIDNFIPKITNWSICDSFCCGLKHKPEQDKIYFDFIQKYTQSDKEFELRFYHVMLINLFTEQKYLPHIFEHLNSLNTDKYYAQMSGAWLICECFTKYQNETMQFLQKNSLQKEIQNKALQKIIESNKIPKEIKTKIKKMRNNCTNGQYSKNE